MRDTSPDSAIPRRGYLGTSVPRSGRQIPLPRWVTNLVCVGQKLSFSYHPRQFYPVFAPDQQLLADDVGDRNRWPAVDSNHVREDGNRTVVQLPARFFSDYKGPQTAIELGPVREEAQIDTREKLHFVVGGSGADEFVSFLLTTAELAALDEDLFARLFAQERQRSLLLDNLEATDMMANESTVVTLFNRLSDVITEADSGGDVETSPNIPSSRW